MREKERASGIHEEREREEEMRSFILSRLNAIVRELITELGHRTLALTVPLSALGGEFCVLLMRDPGGLGNVKARIPRACRSECGLFREIARLAKIAPTRSIASRSFQAPARYRRRKVRYYGDFLDVREYSMLNIVPLLNQPI